METSARRRSNCGSFSDRFLKSIRHDKSQDTGKKLQGCGIAGQMFDILCDYLKDRTQYVELNGIKSKTRVIVCGVPQGSLLGPRLLTIYINNLSDYIDQGCVFLFADDTTFCYVGHDIEEVIDMLNNIGGQVSGWCN